jgi:hypothetical protein
VAIPARTPVSGQKLESRQYQVKSWNLGHVALCVKLIQQHFNVFQVGGVEALSEPVLSRDIRG